MDHIIIDFYFNKKLWEEFIANIPSILHGPHRKRRVQQFLCCSGNVITEPLPSNDRGIQIQIHRLMGTIYEVRL
jgi:hypothetical protein